MAELPDPSEVRSLMRAGLAGFTTLRATVRNWASYRRIAEVQGGEWSGVSEDAGERLTRVFVSSEGHVREELDSGYVFQHRELDEADHWPLFEPRWLADERGLTVVAEEVVAGRPGLVIEAPNPTDGLDLLPGADRCVCVLDRERRVLLRCEAWLGDELLMVEEMTEVVFDEPLDPHLFESG